MELFIGEKNCYVNQDSAARISEPSMSVVTLMFDGLFLAELPIAEADALGLACFANKVQAIKMFRRHHKTGLLEAKCAVEYLAQRYHDQCANR